MSHHNPSPHRSPVTRVPPDVPLIQAPTVCAKVGGLSRPLEKVIVVSEEEPGGEVGSLEKFVGETASMSFPDVV